MSAQFEARYGGTCGECDGRIIPGEHVTYSDDDALIHVACEDSAQPERPAEVCSTCWLTKPCDCD